jgi:hypothetical protein
MSENSFWRTLGKQMKVQGGWIQATRHEDKLNLGIADVSFVNNDGRHGWIELKHEHEWPARESTIVRLKRYTEAQRIFLRDKGEAGGNAWLLVKIGRDVLLFDWKVAQRVGIDLTKDGMIAHATAFWIGKMNYPALGEALCLDVR